MRLEKWNERYGPKRSNAERASVQEYRETFWLSESRLAFFLEHNGITQCGTRFGQFNQIAGELNN